MKQVAYKKNDKMLFKSRRTNEVIQLNVKDKITYNDILLADIPVNTDIIRVDKEIQNAKGLDVVKG